MEILSSGLFFIGVIVMVVGGIWMLIEQFNTSLIWGLGCLFVPLVSLLWLIMHFDRGMYPLITWIAGMALLIGGMFLGGEF